jgi:hypothetical protein
MEGRELRRHVVHLAAVDLEDRRRARASETAAGVAVGERDARSPSFTSPTIDRSVRRRHVAVDLLRLRLRERRVVQVRAEASRTT